MRKFKIFISIFTLYEFMMLTILQIPRYCVGIFNVNFCAHTTFKYFLFCIMLPIISCIFFWWIPEISRLFCPRACNATIQPQPKSSGDVLSEIISKKDIERFITALVIMGIQKFSKKHPKTTAVFDEILTTIQKTNKNKTK